MINTSILQKSQQGFTLIELIIVIVLIGILAAVALPKFFDLKSEARTAALAGVAGSVSSGSVINYAARLAGKPGAVLMGNPTCTVGTLGSLLNGGLPAGYTVANAPPLYDNCSNPAADSVLCAISDGATPTISTTVTVICAR